jgi:NAD(P)-dependent dehydrogenase (short-subunit alcohol dehydrogenase family)
MVALNEVIASNERIASTFPDGLVAVFIGGTSGVGELTVKAFAKYTTKPRIYIVGRSQEAASRIITESKQLNSDGTFEFIKSDISLLQNVDDVCRQIKSKETAINILVQSQGTMGFKKGRGPNLSSDRLLNHFAETAEGLPLAGALALYSRLRFILNLMPLIRKATGLRRVVSVGAATCEGDIDTDNILGRGFPIMKWRNQLAACQTLLLEQVAQREPNVSFIHNVPGIVKSAIGRDAEGFGLSIMLGITNILGPLIQTPPDECGKRHVFLATSAMYPPNKTGTLDGVPLQRGLNMAKGTNGSTGSGVYSVDNNNNSSPTRVETVLALHRNTGTDKIVWDSVVGDFKRITGVEVAP